jgi:hypothetical protein
MIYSETTSFHFKIKRMKKFIFITGTAVWLLGTNVQAITNGAHNRWEALSMIESGNNDAAIGQAGEVSRFQIKPALWEKFSAADPARSRTNPQAALRVAQAIMRIRCAQFERHYHRQPNDFEYYVLWNAPSQIHRPSRTVAERASRFSNLMGS